MTLLEHVYLAARVTIDLSARAEEQEDQIGRHLSANCKVEEVVTALEQQQYDAFARVEKSGFSVSTGQQFEQFLAGLEWPDPGGGA